MFSPVPSLSECIDLFLLFWSVSLSIAWTYRNFQTMSLDFCLVPLSSAVLCCWFIDLTLLFMLLFCRVEEDIGVAYHGHSWTFQHNTLDLKLHRVPLDVVRARSTSSSLLGGTYYNMFSLDEKRYRWESLLDMKTLYLLQAVSKEFRGEKGQG